MSSILFLATSSVRIAGTRRFAKAVGQNHSSVVACDSQYKKEYAMKFMCLAYEDENIFHEMPEPDWHALREETLNYVQFLIDNNHLVSTHPLQSAKTASTVRIREGRLKVIDGPFAETKEQIGGFFLIEARDFDEAVEIASNWPSARLGTIEVRPIEDALRMDQRY